MADPNPTNSCQPLKEDRAELLSFLEAEIRQLSDKQAQDGWTKWTLAAAMGAMAWLLMEQMEKGGAALKNVLLLLLSLGIALMAAQLIWFAMSPDEQRLTSQRRFRMSLGGMSFSEIIIGLGMNVGLLVLAMQFAKDVWWANMLAIALFECVIIGAAVMTIALTYFQMPFPVTRRKFSWKARIILCALALILLVAITDYLLQIQRLQLQDIRVAGLIAVIIALIPYLAKSYREVPVIEALQASRREFILGSIDVSECKKRVDIIIAGMKVADALRDSLYSLVSVLDKASMECREAMKKLDALEEKVPSSSKPLTDAEAVLVLSVFEALKKEEESIASLRKEARMRLDLLGKRLMWVAKGATNKDEFLADTREVFEKVDLAVDQMKDSADMLNVREAKIGLRLLEHKKKSLTPSQ